MNKKELKAYLDKMNKTKLEDLIMGIHAQYPRVRDFIYDTVNPPAIDWEQLYEECRNYVIEASTSNKMGRIAVPAAALDKFTQYGPERDIAIAYIYETFDILVRGLLSLRYCDSFEYSYVGGYVYDCKKYMKKRKWLDDGVNDQFTEIIAKYYEPGSDGYEWILKFAGLL